MKRIFMWVVILLGSSFGIDAQTVSVSGKVSDSERNPVQGAVVAIGSNQYTTDVSGFFSAVNIVCSKGQLRIVADGFEPKTVEFDLSIPTQDLGVIILDVALNNASVNEATYAPLDMEEDSKPHSISGVLHSSSDVFVNTSSFVFSAAYFQIRGYDGEFSEVKLNGLSMTNAENGRIMYSNWGGLNDVTRIKESVDGLNPARFSFGGLVGTTNVDLRPSVQRKQTKISYTVSNKAYSNRLMVTHSTGILNNGWGFTVSASRRWGDGYVKGVFYDAVSYFISVEKKMNSKHSISLTLFGAPLKKGMQSASVQECYDLLNDNHYNPAWGYQDGKVRNSKVRNSHEPTTLLTYVFDISPKTKVATTAGYTFGRNGTTALNWYNATDPRPDYYRYLPSYQTEPLIKEVYANLWKNDGNVSQINWDKLYQINYLANYMGEQAKYIVEERRVDLRQLGLSSNINHDFGKYVILSGGIEFQSYSGRNYKEISDLLGGNYWLDVDQFAERDFSGDSVVSQNDLVNPNHVVRTGEAFGYDYESHVNTQNFWVLSQFFFRKIDFYTAMNASTMQFWRIGGMKNGRYPENSYGESPKHSFVNYAIKTGGTYKISGRHYLLANAMVMTSPPTFRNSYLSPRVNEMVISDMTDRKIFSGDLSYIVRHPKIKGRVTIYYTSIMDDVELNSYYNDYYQTYVNSAMTNVDKVHKGFEMGAEGKVTSSLSLIAVISKGDFRYTSRPTATTSSENGTLTDTSQLIYCKNFYVSGSPQTAGSLGLKWQGANFWYLNLNANYFDDIWVDFAPERRTIGAIDGIYNNEELIRRITQQERVPGQFTLDVSVSKSWKINRYSLLLNASVSNVLDNHKLVTSAYEQLRFDFETKQYDKYPPKYYYGFGRTYFVSLSLRF